MPTPPVFSLRYQARVLVGAIFPSLAGFSERDVANVYPVMTKMAEALDEFGYLHLQATRPDTIGKV